MKRSIIIWLTYLIAFASLAQTTTDSIGIYALNDTSVVPMELINYTNMNISRGFMSAKAKLQFRGNTSNHHFKGTAKFRVFFGQPTPDKLAKLFMFTPSYSINDFGVGKFEVKKGDRMLATANVSVFLGVKSGASQPKNITLDVIELRPGVYDISITGEPGEYCIMHTFRGGSGYNGVFDFTIE